MVYILTTLCCVTSSVSSTPSLFVSSFSTATTPASGADSRHLFFIRIQKRSNKQWYREEKKNQSSKKTVEANASLQYFMQNDIAIKIDDKNK